MTRKTRTRQIRCESRSSQNRCWSRPNQHRCRCRRSRNRCAPRRRRVRSRKMSRPANRRRAIARRTCRQSNPRTAASATLARASWRRCPTVNPGPRTGRSKTPGPANRRPTGLSRNSTGCHWSHCRHHSSAGTGTATGCRCPTGSGCCPGCHRATTARRKARNSAPTAPTASTASTAWRSAWRSSSSNRPGPSHRRWARKGRGRWTVA